ncbi:MAG: hypothetical protein KF835_01125 [Xanthobacteraceae bacterium]|nr:hypothetical protein [Xanthobacteraceae bacterium]
MSMTIKGLLVRIGRIFAVSELRGLNAGQVEELARDVGITAGDLYRLEQAGSPPVAMPRRLELEGINPAIVEAKWPSVWKDMQRLCSFCEAKNVCEVEIELAPGVHDWQRYCPNEGTIRALGQSPIKTQADRSAA